MRITKEHLPLEHAAIITNENIALGGNVKTDAITPANWFQAHFMSNQLLTLDPLPTTIKDITDKSDADSDPYSMAEDYDIQLGRDGSGTSLLAALEGSTIPMCEST